MKRFSVCLIACGIPIHAFSYTGLHSLSVLPAIFLFFLSIVLLPLVIIFGNRNQAVKKQLQKLDLESTAREEIAGLERHQKQYGFWTFAFSGAMIICFGYSMYLFNNP